MLLVVVLCFNCCGGLCLTGPMVHFYVRQIKEWKRERGWREGGWRQRRGGVQELRWPRRPGALAAPAFIFHCHTAPFHPFLVWFLFLLSLLQHHLSTRLCLPSFMRFTAVCHYHLSFSVCFWHSFHSSIKNISTFLPFIYVLYVTSHSSIQEKKDKLLTPW